MSRRRNKPQVVPGSILRLPSRTTKIGGGLKDCLRSYIVVQVVKAGTAGAIAIAVEVDTAIAVEFQSTQPLDRPSIEFKADRSTAKSELGDGYIRIEDPVHVRIDKLQRKHAPTERRLFGSKLLEIQREFMRRTGLREGSEQ